MDEKFSVSLELALNKWKSQIATAKKSMQSLGQTAKSRIAIDNSPLKQMTAQQELLKKQVMDLQQTLVMAQQDTKLFSPSEVLEMRVELEKLESQLNDTTKSSTAFKKVGDNISGTMKKGMQSAKRFTLSLFGIHSIYRMLSRASSAYLAQDTETTNKIQAAWIGLGSVFAPLLQMVADFAIRAVSYLNIFIKALTGLDFLGNAMAKSMGKANKSAKALSKTLAGIDEITNLDSNAGGIGADDTSWISEFKDVVLDENLVKFFKDLGETLKPLKDHLGEIAITLLAVFTGAKLGSILMGIGGIGLKAGLVGIIIAELAGAIWLVIYAHDQLNEIAEENVKKTQQQVNASKDFVTQLGIEIDAEKANADNMKYANKVLMDNIEQNGIEIDQLYDKNNILGILTGTNEKNREQIKLLNEQTKLSVDTLMKNYEAGLLDDDQKKRLIDTLKNLKKGYEDEISIVGKNTDLYKDRTAEIKKTEDRIKELSGSMVDLSKIKAEATVKVGVDTSKAKSGLSKFFGGLGNVVLGMLGVPGNILSMIARLDTGTSYVPNNQLAMIHQGEAVIPKKFNSREYFGMGNDDTNKLLEELIDKVENIEINPYTTIKDVGTASVGYINNQNRIMGRGVI